MLNKFDLTVFFTNYCAVMTLPVGEKSTQKSRGSYGLNFFDGNYNCVGCSYHSIASAESLFINYVMSSTEFGGFLPKYDKQLLRTLSHHFINVYTSLWSSPNPSLVEASNHFISKYLKNDFNYTTVHKRALDGGCSEVLSHNTKLSDYSKLELPMNNREWKGDLLKEHPLCNMTAGFINDTLHLHNKQGDPLFVSFDGVGDVSGLKKYGAIFSSVLDTSLTHKNPERKFLDMFIAMQGDFFILNPRSTFSWQIFLIRTVLGLESVPILKNKDIFVRNNPESDKFTDSEGLWVSWVNIIAESEKIRYSLEASPLL